jgi:hypothetical protein
MGVIDVYFVENEIKDCCRQKLVDSSFDFSSMLSIITGCTTSAPNGSSPRGYSRFFLGIGSKYTYCLLIFHLRYSWYYLLYILLSCSSRSSNGSSPRVHEGVRCDLLYTPMLFFHIALYPYNFACVFSMSFIYAVTALFSARGKL